jgi:catechol 2,3-dioxygenase-like lactoylglutathione lyase family enzyme
VSNTQTRNEATTAVERARTVDMKLEIVVIPVSDVDRAKQFYVGLGWRLDVDIAKDDRFRVVHFTPPGLAMLNPLRQGCHDGRAGLGAGTPSHCF